MINKKSVPYLISNEKTTSKKIFEDNKLELDLNFLLFEDTNQILEYSSVKNSTMGLIGHLNFIHLNWIQIISDQELNFVEKDKITLKKLDITNTACLIVSNNLKPSKLIIDFCKSKKIPLIQSKQSSLQIIWVLEVTSLGLLLIKYKCMACF